MFRAANRPLGLPYPICENSFPTAAVTGPGVVPLVLAVRRHPIEEEEVVVGHQPQPDADDHRHRVGLHTAFLKRRFRIERGQPIPFLDQLDFTIIAIIFATPLVSVDWIFIIIALILTLIIHLIANGGAYLIGLKDIWY